MYQAFKSFLLISLLMPVFINNQTVALYIKSIEIIEKNDGVIVLANYKVKNMTSIGCFLYIHKIENDQKKTLKTFFINEMRKDGTVSSDIIPYSEISKKTEFLFEIKPIDKNYASEIKSVFYNPRQNAKKDITIFEKDNGNIISSDYYIEKYDVNPDDGYKHFDNIIPNNFEDVKVNDIYNYFDVSFFKFKYINGNDNLLKGEFYLDVYDSYDVLKDFPMLESSMYKRIPLKLVKTNDIYNFLYKNELYYESNTHIPSYNFHQGYNKTNFLYFPVEYADKLKEIKCRFIFNIDSHFSFNIKAEFTLRYIKKYFGECNDSDYCMQSNQDDGINVYEKRVEVNI